MIEKLIQIKKLVLGLLFPEKCVGCGEKETVLCQKCLSSVPYADEADDSILAASCYKNETVKKAIWFLKYRGIKELAHPLAELIYERSLEELHFHLLGCPTPKWIIIPIPLSKKRLRRRGYNQAELIAKHLAKMLKSDIECDAGLRKTKETPTQVSIKDREKRLKNIKGAFVVKNSELIKNKNIILVDDVSTTGATLEEAVQVLQKSGAGKIISLVVAKG